MDFKIETTSIAQRARLICPTKENVCIIFVVGLIEGVIGRIPEPKTTVPTVIQKRVCVIFAHKR